MMLMMETGPRVSDAEVRRVANPKVDPEMHVPEVADEWLMKISPSIGTSNSFLRHLNISTLIASNKTRIASPR